MKIAIDLHVHSCLSPCGDALMTPNNVVNMAYIKQLDAVAIADHNSAKNLPAAQAVADVRDVILLPALEVQSKEEVHLLCYFETVEDATIFGEDIYEYLPNMQNNAEVFGKQSILDENDELVGYEPKLLLQSVKLSIEEIVDMVEKKNGVVVPAHINKGANSILSNLGFLPPSVDFSTLEIFRKGFSHDIDLNNYNIIYASDAHYLEDILECQQYIDVEERSAKGIIKWLRAKRNG